MTTPSNLSIIMEMKL